MNPIADDILMHYGVKRRSGRYPWGSGENPYQHGGDFLARVEELEAMGKSQKEIADELKMSTTDLRMQVRVAKHEQGVHCWPSVRSHFVRRKIIG